jgi:hypothetical protein
MSKLKIEGPTNSEGTEGIIINPYVNNDVMPLDNIRCNNSNCCINEECKRHQQYLLDKITTRSDYDNNRIFQAEFYQPKSSQEDYDYKKDGCPKFLQL